MTNQTTFWVIIFAALAFGSIVGFGLLPAIFTGSPVRDITTADRIECESWGSEMYEINQGQSYTGYVNNQPKTIEILNIDRYDGSITVSITDIVAKEGASATINAGQDLVVTGLRIKNYQSSYEERRALLMLDFDLGDKMGTEVCGQLRAWKKDSGFKCEVAFLSEATGSAHFKYPTGMMSCTEQALDQDNRAKLTALCCK